MRSVFRIIAWVESTVLLILIGLLFYLALPLEGKKNIHLDPDSTGGIITQLSQKGYDVGPVDQGLMQMIGTPLPGWVYLGKTRISRLELFARITSRKSHFKNVTLIPGETTYFFLRQLAETMELNTTRLETAYRQLSPFPEAGILADTYRIPLHLQEKSVIRFLLTLSEKRYKKLATKALGTWDPSAWQRILTIASIIQKEAASTREMPLIASVIFNRLAQRRMRLQMDGTLNYGRYSHTRVTPQRIKTDRTTFNTYKHKGLPDSPVCNVSIPAIKAALHPAKTPYLYFMKNSRGTHDFSRTYKAHLKNVHERKLNTKD
jgi:UPF0755 protein